MLSFNQGRMTELFKVVASISDPLALSGIALLVLLYGIKIIFKKTVPAKLTRMQQYKLYRFSILSLLIISLLTLSLSVAGYVFSALYNVENVSNDRKDIVVKGNVFIDHKVAGSVNIKILELEKEAFSSDFGSFIFHIYPLEHDSLTFLIEQSSLNIDTLIFLGVDQLSIPLTFDLYAKTQDDIRKPIYKDYSRKIISANNYYKAGGIYTNEKALQLYHDVAIEILAGEVYNDTLHEILLQAELDYKNNHFHDALRRYNYALNNIINP
jgi:hypothetical protein